MPSTPTLRTLIDELLDQQQTLQTPVALFAEQMEQSSHASTHFKKLIPLTAPRTGEQYAFEVALDRCTGCKACVAACHSLNGLDADESWRDVGLLTGGHDEPHWQQTVTSACHHCASPECMHGCPVGAYEKNEQTGIVHHLDDQCIGCSYCILKCPFDVPKYSKKRGIVRKCDMCHQRLAVGEAPACVQACPTEAIRIITIDKSVRSLEVRRGIDFIIGAPSPAITLPTTRYTGRAIPASAQPVDQEKITAQHKHWPLVIMLTCTQAGLGIVCSATLSKSPQITCLIGALVFFIGMAASVFHLGRPLGAWRFFLGLKTSWLSREILAFSLLAPLVILNLAYYFFPIFFIWLPAISLIIITWIASLTAIFTSIMIYVDTKRRCWSLGITSWRFLGTFIVGVAAFYPVYLVSIVVIKILLESAFLYYIRNAPVLKNLCHLSITSERYYFFSRMGLLILSALLCSYISPYYILVFLLASELCERALYFSTVFAPKMTSKWN